jgi:glycosyltransferase involved in cell wall biosynthesis
VRFHQFDAALRDAGIEPTFAPLLNDQYLADFYGRRGRSIRNLWNCYWKRTRDVLHADSFDAVWMEKELLPWVPAWLEQWMLGGLAYVVDLDDAVFHNYDAHRMRAARALYGRKIDRVMSAAAIVVAGNEYIAQRARAAGSARVEVLPSVVDADAFPQDFSRAGRSGFTVGWIGSPATQHFVQAVVPALEACLTGENDRFVTVGAAFSSPLFPKHVSQAWARATESASLASFDVGIMPLADSQFERGKCGYKLIQYMASALPVIASPVGANCQIVRVGETGFLASSHDEWLAALRAMRDSPELRAEMGATGYATFRREYSLQAIAPKVVNVIRAAATWGR